MTRSLGVRVCATDTPSSAPPHPFAVLSIPICGFDRMNASDIVIRSAIGRRSMKRSIRCASCLRNTGKVTSSGIWIFVSEKENA
jgi:hypothetical protein